MKKLVFITLLISVAAALFLLLNNPVGRLAKLTIEELGSQMTQSDVRVKSISLSLSNGRGSAT